MARRKVEREKNKSKRWLMVGLYPVALFVLFFGVLFFDWMAEAAESDPQNIQGFSDRDADDILERLGIDDIEDDIISELDDTDILGLDDEDDDNPDQLVADTNDISDDIEDDIDVEASDEEIEDAEDQIDNYYYYSVLSESEKKQYSELCKAIEDINSNARIVFDSIDDADRMLCLVRGDHPEYFYIEGFSYYEYPDNVSINIDFTYDDGEIISRRTMNEMAVNEVLDSMPSGMDEYEIIKYCYEWIVNNTDYVLDCVDNQEMTSVFLNHESVCAGYSRAMQYLLQKCNMQAMYVGGYASGRHAWLIVNVEGQYYNLDVTWADNTNPDVPHPDYAYLLLSTEKMASTHTANTDIYPVPNCTAMDSNFYRKENLYVTELDDEVLQEIFDRSKMQFNGSVHMMASDGGMYRALKNYLISEGNLNRFYFGNYDRGNLYFLVNDDLYTLTFYE